MPNYQYTTEAGTERRRAKQVTINNPISLDNWTPSLTFSEEDRIIMADKSEKFIDAGILVVAITPDKLTKLYPQVNVETGQMRGEPRTGAELLTLMFDALADIYITEAMERDARENGVYESLTPDGSMVIEVESGSGVIGD